MKSLRMVLKKARTNPKKTEKCLEAQKKYSKRLPINKNLGKYKLGFFDCRLLTQASTTQDAPGGALPGARALGPRPCRASCRGRRWPRRTCAGSSGRGRGGGLGGRAPCAARNVMFLQSNNISFYFPRYLLIGSLFSPFQALLKPF